MSDINENQTTYTYLSRKDTETQIKDNFQQYYDTLKYNLVTKDYIRQFTELTWDHLKQYVSDKCFEDKSDLDTIESESESLPVLKAYQKYYIDKHKAYDVLLNRYCTSFENLFYYTYDQDTLSRVTNDTLKYAYEGEDGSSGIKVDVQDFVNDNSLNITIANSTDEVPANSRTIALIPHEQNGTTYLAKYYNGTSLEPLGAADTNQIHIGTETKILIQDWIAEHNADNGIVVTNYVNPITQYKVLYDNICNALTEIDTENTFILSKDRYPLYYYNDVNYQRCTKLVNGYDNSVHVLVNHNESIEIQLLKNNIDYDVSQNVQNLDSKLNTQYFYVQTIQDNKLIANTNDYYSFISPTYTKTYSLPESSQGITVSITDLLDSNSTTIKDFELVYNHELKVTDIHNVTKTYLVPNPNYIEIKSFSINSLDDHGQTGLFITFSDIDALNNLDPNMTMLVGHLPNRQVVRPYKIMTNDNLISLKHTNGLTSICMDELFGYYSYEIDNGHLIETNHIGSDTETKSISIVPKREPYKFIGFDNYDQNNKQLSYALSQNNNDIVTFNNTVTREYQNDQCGPIKISHIPDSEETDDSGFYISEEQLQEDNTELEEQIDLNENTCIDETQINEQISFLKPDVRNYKLFDYYLSDCNKSYSIHSFDLFNDVFLTKIDRVNDKFMFYYSDGTHRTYHDLVNTNFIKDICYNVNYDFDSRFLVESITKTTNIDLTKRYDFMPYLDQMDLIHIDQYNDHYVFSVNDTKVDDIYMLTEKKQLTSSYIFTTINQGLRLSDYGDLTQYRLSNHNCLFCDNLNYESLLISRNGQTDEKQSISLGNGLYIAYDELHESASLDRRTYRNVITTKEEQTPEYQAEHLVEFKNRALFRIYGASIMLPTVDVPIKNTENSDENYRNWANMLTDKPNDDTIPEFSIGKTNTKTEKLMHLCSVNGLDTKRQYRLTFISDKPLQDFQYYQDDNGNYVIGNTDYASIHNTIGLLILSDDQQYDEQFHHDIIDSRLHVHSSSINPYTYHKEISTMIVDFVPEHPNISIYISLFSVGTIVSAKISDYSLMKTHSKQVEDGLYVSI